MLTPGPGFDIAALLFTAKTVDFNGLKLPGLGFNFARDLTQYARHICPGMTNLETGITDSVPAYDAKARELVIVARNSDNEDTKTFDLSKFTVHNGPVTRWIT